MDITFQPTPPKKPPRRTVPTSPVHTFSGFPLSSEQNGCDTYEYAFVKINSSQDQIDFNDSQVINFVEWLWCLICAISSMLRKFQKDFGTGSTF